MIATMRPEQEVVYQPPPPPPSTPPPQPRQRLSLDEMLSEEAEAGIDDCGSSRLQRWLRPTQPPTSRPAQRRHTLSEVREAIEKAQKPSIGSQQHGRGQCSPCPRFWSQEGCPDGARCQHCHLCNLEPLKVPIFAALLEEEFPQTVSAKVMSYSDLPQMIPEVGRRTAPAVLISYERPDQRGRMRGPTSPERSVREASADDRPPTPPPPPRAPPGPSQGLRLPWEKPRTPPKETDEDGPDGEGGERNGETMLALHERGECKPCAYLWYKQDGCRMDSECRFCHLCDKAEIKRKKKVRAKMKKKTSAADYRATQDDPLGILDALSDDD